MIDVEIRTTERTIQERIKDWKELEELLLKYKDYVSISANNRKETDYERHTR